MVATCGHECPGLLFRLGIDRVPPGLSVALALPGKARRDACPGVAVELPSALTSCCRTRHAATRPRDRVSVRRSCATRHRSTGIGRGFRPSFLVFVYFPSSLRLHFGIAAAQVLLQFTVSHPLLMSHRPSLGGRRRAAHEDTETVSRPGPEATPRD